MYFFVLFFLTMRRQIQSVPTQSVLLVASSLTYSLQTHDQVQIRSLRHWQEDTLRMIGDFVLVTHVVRIEVGPVVYNLPLMSFFLTKPKLPKWHRSRTLKSFRASRSLMSGLPLVPPLFPAGKEPLPPGFTEDDRQVMLQNKRMQNYMQMGMESCLTKTVMAAGMGAC